MSRLFTDGTSPVRKVRVGKQMHCVFQALGSSGNAFQRAVIFALQIERQPEAQRALRILNMIDSLKGTFGGNRESMLGANPDQIIRVMTISKTAQWVCADQTEFVFTPKLIP